MNFELVQYEKVHFLIWFEKIILKKTKNKLSELIKRTIFSIILFALYILSEILVNLTQIEVNLDSKLRNKNDFLLTINCNKEDCKRAIYAYEKYAKNFTFYDNIDVLFVSTKIPKGYENMTILAPKTNEKLEFQLYNSTIAAYEYFIERTLHQFYWRTTDDTYIDIDKFLEFINSVDRDPAKFILKGQVLCNYVHGGPGWLVNRKTAMAWLDEKKYWGEFLREFNLADDILPYYFLQNHNISFHDANVENIIGPFIDEPHEHILKHHKWDLLPNCSQQIINDMKSPYYYMFPFNKAFIWHGGCPSNIAVVSGKELLSTTPDFVIVLSNQFYSIICKKTPFVDDFKFQPPY